MRPRRVLVTGAGGFLGSAVVDGLLAGGEVEQVVGVDLRPTTRGDGRYAGVQGDVADGLAVLLDRHRVDAVVHHAFVIQPPRDLAAARRVNVEATARLAADASAAGVSRIVYPSSTTVYGARAGSGLHTEDEEPRPLPGFTYSEHKVAAERALWAAMEQGGPSVVVLRGCVVAGPGATGFILASLALPLLPMPTGADPEMQFLHVDDYVAAVATALGAEDPGTFNVAGRGPIRARRMARLVGSRVLPLPEPLLRGVIRWSWRLRLQGRSPDVGLAFITHPWLASTERAAAVLGWEPNRTSEDAITAWAGWRTRHRNRRPGGPGA